jgi:anaerobic magnesium-protoporphyrin IX monomethyl ester cyclase
MKISLIKVSAIEGDNLAPPLGMLSLAAVLEEAGHKVQFHDVDPDFYDVTGKVEKFNPDFIGIGFLTNTCEKSLKLIKALKAKMPKKKYFGGGVHATTDPKGILETFGMDFVFSGEGEIALKEVCKRFEEGKDFKGIKGIAYKEKGKFIENGKGEPIANMDDLPMPARHLVDFEKLYLTFPGVIRGNWCKSTTMMTSRGCPYSCIYCGSHITNSRRVRRMSVDRALAEVRHLVNTYGIEGIFFVDDIFALDHEWTIDFCTKLRKESFKLIWACQGRVDSIDEKVLIEMKKAGCVQMDFGVESGSDRILKILKKGATVAETKKAFALTKKVGIRSLATFIVNNPYETMEDLDMTFNLAKEIKPDFTTFFFSTPFPGTELYDLAMKEGWFDKEKNYSDEWNIRNSEVPIMEMGTTLSAKEIMDYRAKMQNHFFARNYLRWGNFVVGMHLAVDFLKKPMLMKKAIGKILKTGKVDQAFEVILIENRLNILKSL